ncbi:MAG: sulfotransferase, partial [Gaiellales bacterium]
MSVRPVFVFSLPRSGSTLLQRMVATHPEIATASEPWILLPQLYALRETGIVAEYGHRTAARAIADFGDSLPGGRDDYLDEVRRSALALYN